MFRCQFSRGLEQCKGWGKRKKEDDDRRGFQACEQDIKITLFLILNY